MGFTSGPAPRTRLLRTVSSGRADRHARGCRWTAAIALAACAAGLPVWGQIATIDAVEVTSQPGGGSDTRPVWIVGDEVVVDVRYSVDLEAAAAGTLKIELDEVGDGFGSTREAACAVKAGDARVLSCVYTIEEGDVGTGIAVEARVGTLRGTRLPAASVFQQRVVRGSSHDIDGVRLRLATGGVVVRLLDEDGLIITDRDGAKAGETVAVSFAFEDGETPDYSPDSP